MSRSSRSNLVVGKSESGQELVLLLPEANQRGMIGNEVGLADGAPANSIFRSSGSGVGSNFSTVSSGNFPLVAKSLSVKILLRSGLPPISIGFLGRVKKCSSLVWYLGKINEQSVL